MDKIFIGYDSREHVPAKILEFSIKRRLNTPAEIHFIRHKDMRFAGLFSRKWRIDENGQMWDEKDGAPCSTEFSYTRFLTPTLVGFKGRALFMDCDMLAQDDLTKLFEEFNPNYAVQVVKHNHNPDEETKMDRVIQTKYSRKNWSSVMLFNCEHPKVQNLTSQTVDEASGLHLHRFEWLDSSEIGELSPRWNHLAGIDKRVDNPGLIHYTEKAPWFEGQESCAYAENWFREETMFRNSLPSAYKGRLW